MTNAQRRERFETVVEVVADPVRAYLRRRTDQATADDVLSETLLALWRRIEDVPDEVVPWAIGVARLQLANAERSQRRQNRLVARVITVDRPTGIAPEEDVDLRDEVAAAMSMLRRSDQEVLRLWAWDGLEPRDIAPVLGVSVNAATVRLHRARKKFALFWSKTHPGSGHVDAKEGARNDAR